MVDGRVYASVYKSGAAQIDQLAGANPQPRIVAVLDDISTWSPAPEGRVDRPAAIPAAVPLYAPYTDGALAAGPGDAAMSGLHAQPHELAAAWVAREP